MSGWPVVLTLHRRFFAARGIPIIFSTLLAAGLLWLRQHKLSPARFASAPVLAIVLGLAIFQFLMHDIITTRWEFYVLISLGLQPAGTARCHTRKP